MDENLKANIKGDPDVLSALNDLSLLDITTNPEYSKEDQANAEATIAAREEAGTYDDSGEQIIDTEEDLLNHNYGVLDGKIYAPAEEYRNIGNVALDNFDEHNETPDDFSARVPIPGKKNQEKSEPINENFEHKQAMREAEEAKDKKRTVWGRTPEFKQYVEWTGREKGFMNQKYEKNTYYEPSANDIQADIEARRDGVQELSPTKRMEKALDYAKFKAKKTPIENLYTEGALDDIAEGMFVFNPNYIKDGFASYYGKEIDRRAGATKDLVWDTIRNDDFLPTIDSIEQLERLESKAVKTAVEIGATRVRDGKTGEEHVEFALPLEKLGDERVSKEVTRFGMGYNGLYEENADGELVINKEALEIYEAFESGFVNIVDAIKEDGDSQNGFEELDWYFDHLLVGMPEEQIAERVLDSYEAAEKDSFVDKFNQFIIWREERRANIAKVVGEKDDNEFEEEEVNFLETHKAEIFGASEDDIVFPVVGKGTERAPRGGKGHKNPNDYGRRKGIAFLENLRKLQQIPGFEKGEPFLMRSKPYYLDPNWKKIPDESGKEGTVLDHMNSRYIEAHYDTRKGVYVSNKTGNEIDSQNIRQYLSAYFTIDGVNVSIKESITNMCGSLYIVFGEDAIKPNQEVFHHSIDKAIDTIRGQGRKIIKKNHCKTVVNGVKGYHKFDKMWDATVNEILKYVKQHEDSETA